MKESDKNQSYYDKLTQKTLRVMQLEQQIDTLINIEIKDK